MYPYTHTNKTSLKLQCREYCLLKFFLTYKKFINLCAQQNSKLTNYYMFLHSKKAIMELFRT